MDKNIKRRHYFFLNPYNDQAFTRCPKCTEKTKLRKFPLVVHVEPAQIICLNKNCIYCERCDLIVAKRTELESLMVMCCENINSDIIGNNYLVVGTLDRKDWKMYSSQKDYSDHVIDRAYIFKDVKHFEIIQGGWMKDK